MKCCVSGILFFYFFLGAIAAVSSNQSPERKFSGGYDPINQVLENCSKKNILSCLESNLFSYLDKTLVEEDSVSLAEGVSVEKTELAPRAGRAVDDKQNDTETAFFSRFERFMESHNFKFNIKGSDVLNTFSSAADSLGLLPETESEEGRRRKKKKTLKMLLPLIMALKLKLIALLPVGMAVIAFMIKKALIIGKIALGIASILGLKQLFQGKQDKTTTYEIINHPHHTNHEVWSSDGGLHGGWGRIGSDAQDMAYKSYQPQQQ